MQKRRLGATDIEVTPIALGCWPITGITSAGTSERDSLRTIQRAVDGGINFLDTAYMYGYAGESEQMIARAVGSRRDRLVIATKGGLHWNENRERAFDATPATVRRECEESLQRLGTDHVDLLYLHAADPKLPIEEQAVGFKQLLDAGKTRSVGVSNLTVEQIEAFRGVCPVAAVQSPYNMLQRDIEADILPYCRQHNIALAVYWPLMKGLLAGKLGRDHVFPPEDGRSKYPMFQGEEWQKNQDFLDELRPIARDAGRSVAQLVIRWTIQQPGVTAALVGAKRPDQIEENIGAAGWELSAEQMERIESALQRRGKPVTRSAV